MSIVYMDRPIKNNQAYIKNAQIADSRYEDFQQRGPMGAVLHSIGTPQPEGKPIADYFDSPDVEASVHMVLQPDGLCYRLAPDNYRMWHGGGTVNNTHMGIEMTEPREISYDPDRGYAVTVHNREAALEHVVRTYDRAVELFASLCRTYGWDPLEDGVILSHKECYERGIGSNHGDPEHLWDVLDTGYTMDTFRQAVAKALEPVEKEVKEPVKAVRFRTLGDLKAHHNSAFYLPTVEKLLERGFLFGKGGEGDDLVLDFSEDSLRILVLLDRNGTFE